MLERNKINLIPAGSGKLGQAAEYSGMLRNVLEVFESAPIRGLPGLAGACRTLPEFACRACLKSERGSMWRLMWWVYFGIMFGYFGITCIFLDFIHFF